jgi:hypothetical protein
VVVLDIVTGRKENLYEVLLEQLGLALEENGHGDLYAMACRPVPHDEPGRLDAWLAPQTIGSELPTLPLWLEDDLAVPLDLERSYQATFVELRVAV